MKITYNKIIDSLTNQEYHGHQGTFSSSQLKAMLEDPEVFYKKYIAKTEPRKSTSSMDVGTYVHTAVLEPDMLEKETAIFMGAAKRGKEWEKFQAENQGKCIISATEATKAAEMISAIKASPIAMKHIEGYLHEVSLFVEVYVMLTEMRDESIIYHIDTEGDVYRLTNDGWLYTPKSTVDADMVRDFGHKLILKVRADSINFETKDISDVKTTSVNPKNLFEVQGAINSYEYDMSAAFYLDMFSLAGHGPMKTFTWIFTSSVFGTSKTWTATPENILIGRAKWRKAIIDIAYYESIDWVFSDELGYIPPSAYQRDWLNKFTE